MDRSNSMIYFFITFFILSFKAYSYPQFIGHSYNSCINCHYNPFGGGQLTDYGRAVSATAISARSIYPKEWSEEKLAYMSGFLFKKPEQKWFRPQVNYRGFELRKNPGSKKEVKSWMQMQADVRVTLLFGEADQFMISGDYGKVPESTHSNLPDDGKFRSRNLYAGYRPNKEFGLYAGLMDKVYGIRLVEHIAYSRTIPQVTQNDQTHGVAGHFIKNKWEGGAHLFVGNLNQRSDLRMKGVSSTVERDINGGHRIGGSAMFSKNSYLQQSSYSAHGRFSFKEGSAILSELGQTHSKTENGSGDKISRYGILQTYVRPYRGLYLLANIEYLKPDLSEDNYVARFGPGMQYFPGQRIELRGDIYNTRNIKPDSSTRDNWLLLTQIHLWL